MFLAPITLPRDAEVASASPKSASKSARARVKPVRMSRRDGAARSAPAIERAAVRYVLLAWLAVGCGVALLFPQWLSSRSLGASTAFWLVGAPLVDLAWLSRAHLRTLMRDALARARPRAQARRV